MIKTFISKLFEWSTKRRIIVIQSDDWGSVRMPSNEICEKLSKDNMLDLSDPYNRFDTLESEKDITALLNVLSSVKDSKGRHPVITANCLMANPNFDLIRSNGYNSYHFEPVYATFERYNQSDAWVLWKKAIEHGFIYPQFHGREHVNVSFWLQALRSDMPGVRHACDYGVFGAKYKALNTKKQNFQEGWDYRTGADEAIVNQSIDEGLKMFRDIYGFDAVSATPPAYLWGRSAEVVLKMEGVRGIQCIKLRKFPVAENSFFKNKLIFSGKRNTLGLQYIPRNAFFEKSQSSLWNAAGCLRRIDDTFRQNQPVVIGAHRLNFIGGLNERNRTENLKEFKWLLHTIVSKWPDVEFMDTGELLHLMERKE